MKNRLTDLIRAVPIADKTYPEYIEAVVDKLMGAGAIIFPCKVGDKAYHLTGIDTRKELDLTDVFEGKVCSISKQEDAIWIFCRYNNGLTYWYKESDIGRKLFLTQEEVEKALDKESEDTE